MPVRSRASPWLWAVATILLVAATGLATWRVFRNATPAARVADTAPSPRLTEGHDYYLHVKLIELADQPPDGKQWDSSDDSGPDIRFRLTWREQRDLELDRKRPNTLIGSWDLMKVDLKQVIRSGGQTDLEGMVNAPLVHYERGGTVELKVWDEDTVGSDDAGAITIQLDDLDPGREHAPAPPATTAKAVRACRARR